MSSNFNELRSLCHSGDYCSAADLIACGDLSSSEIDHMFEYSYGVLVDKDLWKSSYLTSFMKIQSDKCKEADFITERKSRDSTSILDKHNHKAAGDFWGSFYSYLYCSFSGMYELNILPEKVNLKSYDNDTNFDWSKIYNGIPYDILNSETSWHKYEDFVSGEPYHGMMPVMYFHNPWTVYYYIMNGKNEGKIAQLYDGDELTISHDNISKMIYDHTKLMSSYYENYYNLLPRFLVNDILNNK